jgi:aminoacyl-tRNA hydrolase
VHAVIGLGNPGPSYAATRHNVGQMVVGLLAERAGGRLSSVKNTGALALTAHIGPPPSAKALLGVSTEYMNVSGGPIKALLAYFSIDPDELMVVHDDLDLPFGALRLKRGGGEGGHNGLKSISQALGTRDYIRLRCGIGRPPGRQDPADFVLSPFSARERADLGAVIEEAADAAVDVLARGLTAAQMRLHTDRG